MNLFKKEIIERFKKILRLYRDFMPKALVSGSLAYDYLYTFKGNFKDELFASKDGPLSVSFYITDKTVHFGGCSGNIVFNGKLVGVDFILLGIAGKDFGDYEKWLNKNKIDTSAILRDPDEFTSQAAVATDSLGQQITFFHGGAASKSANYRSNIEQIITKNAPEITIALIAPNHRDFMMATIDACRKNRIPYIFDPGQAIAQFSDSELLHITNSAAGLIMNEYEFSIFEKSIKLPKNDVFRLCPLTIITLGEKGSVIYFEDEEIKIPPKKPKIIRDPTGCGDAFRAGFLSGILPFYPKLNKEILAKAGAKGTELATRCLEHIGTQNH